GWRERCRRFPLPYHPNVSMGWDSTPRTVPTERYDPVGYPWLAVLEGNTPAAFRAALLEARHEVEQTAREGAPARLVTLNAWNEWTEGSYLLPDTVHGTAYLEAVRDVFGPSPAPGTA
ncbi:MAG TPA: glycoside hydrolase family 99-like domain-containing protein, partial [Chloroflexota bacterium]|nr:glycoside hydrolase family 99-like domain-containing protein [Chloroflexota bacterium]